MKLKNFLENFILVAIILVIIQTFLHELSIYSHWSVNARNIMIFLGFFFDLLFTIEFIVRTIASLRKKHVMKYWLYERGWVDFLSSMPLLLLDSGPSVFILLTGVSFGAESAFGVLNVLKVVKAVRVTRILRLVRIIKIFGKIHNAESKMAQHHTATIATTAVFTIVTALILFSVFTDRAGVQTIESRRQHYQRYIKNVETIQNSGRISKRDVLRNMFAGDSNILRVYYNKVAILSTVEDEDFRTNYNYEDYIEIPEGNVVLFVSIVDIHRGLALNHIESFIIIVCVVLAFMIIYTRHFAQNISDLLHIMNKGFRKKNYNLEIKMHDEYSDQEIFRLVKFYNDSYLPAKLRRIQEEDSKKKSGLSMNDLMDFNK